MTREVTVAVDTALIQENVVYLAFVELLLDSGEVRLTNCAHDFLWDGYTWLGAANCGSIEAVEETTELQQNTINLKLSGIPTDFDTISIALNENYQDKRITIWLGILDSGHRIIPDPVIVFRGRLDNMNMSPGESSEIIVSAESRISDWDRARVRRYNHEDQIAVYPDDRGFEFVQEMVETQFVWGREG